MRKKLGIILLMIIVIVLAACGDKGKDKEAGSSSSGDSKVLEASIEKGTFILSSKSSEFDPEGDTGTIRLDVSVKNKSDESFNLYPENDMQLYDGDEQIDALSIFDTSIDIDVPSNTSVGADKKKTFTVLFEVERNKEYELNIEPLLMSATTVEPVTFDVNMADYDETYEVLQEPIDALNAYVQTIYFDEEDENLEKLMEVDQEELEKSAEKGFLEFLKDATFADVSGKQAAKLFDTYKEELKEKGSFDVELVGNSGDKATLTMDYEGISAMDVGDEYSKLRKEYLEKSSDYSVDQANEYALSKLDKIISKVDPKAGGHALDITMTKKDGKWSFEDNYTDIEETLEEIFAGGRIY